MRKIQYIIYVALAALSFVSCQEEDFGSGAKGSIRISLTEASQVEVLTKSTPSELWDEVKENFKIQVTGTSYNETFKYTDGLIPLPEGTYNVKATCGQEQADGVIEYDAPYFVGEKEDVEVSAAETPVSINCKVGNALVSVEKAEGISEEVYVNIQVGNNGNYTTWDDFSKSAYFKTGSRLTMLTISSGKGSDSKSIDILEEHKNEIPEFTAGTHLQLKLKPKDNSSGLSFSVELKVDTVPISETIPMEWLPAPKIAGFNSEGTVSVEQVETADAVPAVLNFSGAMAIQDVELTLDLKDQDFSSLNKTYKLASLSDDDRSALGNAGITLPALGENASSIDFTTLAGKLKVASGSETSHDIKLRVKANDRWSSEEGEPSVYTIKTVAPKITVTANEGDIWSKSVTISGITVEAGNESTIKENLKYQFYENGTWKDCEGMVAAMENHPSDGKMQVRAVYRDVIECEPTTFDLETPAQLPNSDMEKWQYEIYKEWETGLGIFQDKVKHTYYSFMPWSKDENKVWDTNNVYTTRHRYNSSTTTYDKNGLHAVSYVVGRNNSGLAAELRNTANGRGNNDITGVQSYNIVSGELFTGTAKLSMGAYGNIFNDASGADDKFEPIKDVVFKSRPTALSFWYKYKPLDGSSDAWSVYIQLLDANGNTIVEKEEISSDSQQDWKFETVLLPYEDDKVYSKCNYIFIDFKSSSKNGSDVPYSEQTLTFYIQESNGSLTAKTHSPAYVGSVLTIDDIQLIYDK